MALNEEWHSEKIITVLLYSFSYVPGSGFVLQSKFPNFLYRGVK